MDYKLLFFLTFLFISGCDKPKIEKKIDNLPGYLKSIGWQYKYCSPQLIQPFGENDFATLCRCEDNFSISNYQRALFGIDTTSDSKLKFRAFSFHEYKNSYLLSISNALEHNINIKFYLCSKEKNKGKLLFSINGFGDAGCIVNDFAVFDEKYIKIQYLNISPKRMKEDFFDVNYRQCVINLEDNNPKIDTIKKIKKTLYKKNVKKYIDSICGNYKNIRLF